jgi:hypothetical protein
MADVFKDPTGFSSMLQSVMTEPKKLDWSSIYKPSEAPTTTDFVDAGWTESEGQDYLASLFGDISSTAQQGVVKTPQNTAQASQKQSNYIQDAHDAVMDLMKGGQAIPRSLAEPETGSGKASGLDLTKYAGVDRDIRGNIIGLTARMQYDPVSGAPTGKIGTDWKADTGGLGRPYTPGLDAFKQAQVESAKASAEAASTPAALQSEANRQAYLQSKIPSLPKGATATEIQTPTGTQRTVIGPSGYAQAFIPKKKPQDATA